MALPAELLLELFGGPDIGPQTALQLSSIRPSDMELDQIAHSAAFFGDLDTVGRVKQFKDQQNEDIAREEQQRGTNALDDQLIGNSARQGRPTNLGLIGRRRLLQ